MRKKLRKRKGEKCKRGGVQGKVKFGSQVKGHKRRCESNLLLSVVPYDVLVSTVKDPYLHSVINRLDH